MAYTNKLRPKWVGCCCLLSAWW